MIDATLKAKWVEALRSGKYIQGQGRLKTELINGECAFCCLGVLKEIDDTVRVSLNYPRLELDVDFIDRDVQNKLASMNDSIGSSYGKNYTFSQIADYIEASEEI